MSGTKKTNTGAVSTIGDSDLVMMVGPNGSYHPISFANLMSALQKSMNLRRSTIGNFYTGNWIRIAELGTGASGILSITHTWRLGRPKGIVIALADIGTDVYDISVLSTSSNVSFSNLRIVKESDVNYLEVQFALAETGTIIVSLACGLEVNLIPATIITGSPTTILKSVNLGSNAWGGVKHYCIILYNLGRKGGRHESSYEKTPRSTLLVVPPKGVHARNCQSIVSRRANVQRRCTEHRREFANWGLYNSSYNDWNISCKQSVPVWEDYLSRNTKQQLIRVDDRREWRNGKPNTFQWSLECVAHTILNDLARKEVAV